MEREPASPQRWIPSSRSCATARLASAVLAACLPVLSETPAPVAAPSPGKAVATPDSVPSGAVAAVSPQPLSASLHWTIGAGAPSFPQRDRFRLESARRAERDSLSIDQPWDGSQLGFGTSVEGSFRWSFLRPVAGAQWTFWDSRAILRDRLTGALLERTWRVDQLVGQLGFDALVPSGLLTVAKARDPYVGWRACYGVGRLEGLGRAWARGGGWQAHVGADVWTLGPFDLGGRFGWSSLAMQSDEPFRTVLYEGDGSDDLSWNGSGLWLELVLRLDSRPHKAAVGKSAGDGASSRP